jgi:hypothetical protein
MQFRTTSNNRATWSGHPDVTEKGKKISWPIREGFIISLKRDKGFKSFVNPLFFIKATTLYFACLNISVVQLRAESQ